MTDVGSMKQRRTYTADVASQVRPPRHEIETTDLAERTRESGHSRQAHALAEKLGIRCCRTDLRYATEERSMADEEALLQKWASQQRRDRLGLGHAAGNRNARASGGTEADFVIRGDPLTG